jgi:hypothetical protein
MLAAATPAEIVQKSIDNGLQWLAKEQAADGHWSGKGGMDPTAMTALAGTTFLMEGSTLRDGKYSKQINKAVDWLIQRSQRDGLIGDPDDRAEASRYMYGHGFAMLFLASVCSQEEKGDSRKKLEAVLTRAVDFCGKAQMPNGGWGYVSLKDGGRDEGSHPVVQVQGLRACREAGIDGTKPIIDKSLKYLEKCTTPRGGVIYSLGQAQEAKKGGEHPGLTAAAITCSFSAGQYDADLVKKWIEYCKPNIAVVADARFGYDEYVRYYYAQAMYALGDTGYERLFPNSARDERLTWSKYKAQVFPNLIRRQDKDGSWAGKMGPVFDTAVNQTILQLDSSSLPIYRQLRQPQDKK